MAELELKTMLKMLADPRDIVSRDEIEYSKKIADAAKRIVESKEVRVVLLAGPSGSGKTTTANLISDKIKSMGVRSMVVSLDDFYRDATDPKYPRLEDGTRDFESPMALDIEALVEVLGNIVSGKPFSVPKYDFKVGGRVAVTEYGDMADGCVIIEGIHGLNPILSDSFPKERVLKLFVSVSTNVNDGACRILSGRKLRFVRRLVRDSIYRASDAYRTLGMWENVRHGEDMYLYPYKDTADIKFDTFHTFEASVLKPYAEKLLTDEVCERSSYAAVVARALSRLPAMETDIVPETSLIREFIPGGIYEELY